MGERAFSVLVDADAYNAWLYFGKLARMSESRGLVGDLQIEPGESVKVRLTINAEETIQNARRRTRRKNVDLRLEIDPTAVVRELFREVVRYLRSREQAAEKEHEGHLRILSSSE